MIQWVMQVNADLEDLMLPWLEELSRGWRILQNRPTNLASYVNSFHYKVNKKLRLLAPGISF